jgi:hypothetical protein
LRNTKRPVFRLRRKPKSKLHAMINNNKDIVFFSVLVSSMIFGKVITGGEYCL